MLTTSGSSTPTASSNRSTSNRFIATKVETGAFYPAEAYHQDFARRNPSHPYIMRWDRPKVAAAKAAYPGLVG